VVGVVVWERVAFVSLLDMAAGYRVAGPVVAMKLGGAYLDAIFAGHYATANIFKARGYLNPRMVSAILRQGLPVLPIDKGLAAGNRASRALFQRVGRKLLPNNGVGGLAARQPRADGFRFLDVE
jgi:hypothetical protein